MSITNGRFDRSSCGLPVKKLPPPHRCVLQFKRSLAKYGGTLIVMGAAGFKATKGPIVVTNVARCEVVNGQHRCGPRSTNCRSCTSMNNKNKEEERKVSTCQQQPC